MNFCVKRLAFDTELDDFRYPFRAKTQTLFHIYYVSFERRTPSLQLPCEQAHV